MLCTIVDYTITHIDWAYSTLTAIENNVNNCVSRTDTNPPFAFDIAFSRAQVLRGFYRDG